MENVPALAVVSITPIVRIEGWTYVAVSMSDVDDSASMLCLR